MHEQQLMEKMKEIRAQDGAEAAYYYYLGAMEATLTLPPPTPAPPVPATKMADG